MSVLTKNSLITYYITIQKTPTVHLIVKMSSSFEVQKLVDELHIAYAVTCDIQNIDQHITVTHRDLTIVSQNIRSVYCNIDDLNIMLCLLKFSPDVIILSECRIDPCKQIPSLSNYKSYSSTNHINQNDGVVVYVKADIFVKSIKEIMLQQASCLQIDINNTAILGIYRSPSNLKADNFIDSLGSHLDSLKSYHNIVITGDININIIADECKDSREHNNRCTYLDTLAARGLLPGHTLPTRKLNCLDHIILKLDQNKLSANIAVLNTSITDHAMIFLSLCFKETVNKKKYKLKTTVDYDKALVNLSEKNLNQILLHDDPNTVTELLVSKIAESLQENTTLARVPKSKRIIKPWITTGMLRCIQNRNKLQKMVQGDPFNEILKLTYKRYRNYCCKLRKTLKRNYEKELLLKSTANPKVLWKNINSIVSRASKSENTKLLNVMTSPIDSVNHANEYFACVGKKLAEDISQNFDKDLPRYNNEMSMQLNSFVLLDTDPTEVNDVIISLKSSSASGWDNIPSSFIKLAKNELIPIICHLTNLCFKKGIFPLLLKKSIITPVYKSGDESILGNYRPISVLPSISKILEKLLNNRLINYLEKYNILSKAQYGFRHGKSTDDAILDLTSYIVNKMDRGEKCLAVFLDLQKAFDTVSIPTLVSKLEMIGVRDNALRLFKSYLSDRSQRVKIGEHVSKDTSILFGVPQGSVLGPTLFLVYINTLCDLKLDGAKVVAYADDTALVFSDKTWESVKVKTELGLSKVAGWLRTNLLTLNTSKTNFLCFSIYNRSQLGSDFSIKLHLNGNVSKCGADCSCPLINKVNKTKYLGIYLDQRLSWHPQIEFVSKRIRKLTWVFQTLRHVTNKDLIKKIYKALAQSVLGYGIAIWGGTRKTKFLEIERAQRSLLKVMDFKPRRYPTHMLYNGTQLLSVRKLYILLITLKVHKTLTYDNKLMNKRRKHKVALICDCKTSFATIQFTRQSAHIYNNINKILNIYSLNYYECKKIVTEWLNAIGYDETEQILKYTK